MSKITLAVIQMACTWDRENVLQHAAELVRSAAGQGAQIILLQELFETPYFCQSEAYEYLQLATKLQDNPAVCQMQQLAAELNVVIPVSFYEKCGNTGFNSIAMLDAGGALLGIYRKSHIPDGPAYEEKFYFTPGDTGFKVWKTRYGRIGVGICWDQWFPEAARCMALQGAELLLYPTAIGSEAVLPIESRGHWMRCIQGHAAANIMPVAAANRVGTESAGNSSMTFYGSSFIADETGQVLAQAGRNGEEIILAQLDLDAAAKRRVEWGVYRDRRPELYGMLMTHGENA